MKKKIPEGFFIITLLVLTYILIADLFYNKVNFFKVGIFGILFGILLNIIFLFIFYKFLISKIKNEKKAVCLIFIMIFIIQILFSYVFVVKPSWDFGTIFYTVNKSILKERGLLNWNYFYRYENNVALAIFLRIIFGVFSKFGVSDFLPIAIVLNIFMIDIAIFYLYKILRMIYSKERSLIFLIFTMFVTPFITYSPIFYTDTFALPFVSASLYYFFQYIWEVRKNKNLIMCGLLIGIGSCLKITVIFILIAIIIFLFFYEKKIFTFKLLKSFVILLIVCILPLILLKAVKCQRLDDERLNNIKFPITHWIMMGLNENTNGVYSQSDVDYTISFPNVLTKKEQNIKIIKQRFVNYKKNNTLLKFYTKKLVKTWGDGTFYAPVKLRRSPMKNYDLKKYIIGTEKEAYIYNAFSQAQLIMMLFFSIIAIAFRKKIESKNEQCLFLCSIIFFGLVLFFIIWETRSRYLVNYIPVLLLNMFVGIDYCLNLLKSKINKKEGE